MAFSASSARATMKDASSDGLAESARLLAGEGLVGSVEDAQEVLDVAGGDAGADDVVGAVERRGESGGGVVGVAVPEVEGVVAHGCLM